MHAACRRAAARRSPRRGRRTRAPIAEPRGARPRASAPRPPVRRRRSPGARAPAGFVSGPRRLNAVRTPISRRVGPACFIAGWKPGAKRNAKPCRAAPPPPTTASWSIRTPSASSTSAEPDRDVIARLPCFATGTPAAATTRAAVVEMLNVPLPSPPVPHVSIAPSGRVDPEDPLAHRGREPGQLVDRLAAHPERDEQGRQLGRASPRRPSRCPSRRGPRRGSACRRRRPWPGRPGRGRSSGRPPRRRARRARRPGRRARPCPAVANEPVSVVEPGCLALRPASRRKFASRCGPCGRQDATPGGTGRPPAAAPRGGCPSRPGRPRSSR